MKTFELTASRWHKISQRLTVRATELADSVKATFAGTRVEGFSGTEQVNLLKERTQEGLKAIEDHQLVMEAIAKIRSALAEVNASAGIAALLAEQEVLNRRIKLLRDIVAAQRSDMVSVDALSEYKPFSEGAARSIYGRESGIQVRLLSREQETEFKAQIQTLQAKLYAVADEANDKNRDKISIELDEAIAVVAGLE